MTQADNNPSPEDRQRARARREELIERFEKACQSGQRPVLEEYLPAEPEERRAVLVELAHADLEMRLKAGEAARAAEYLQRYPEWINSEEAVELIGAEFEFRRRREPDLTSDECFRAYPRYRAALAEWKTIEAPEEVDKYETLMASPTAPATQSPPPGQAVSPGAGADTDKNVNADDPALMTFSTRHFDKPEDLQANLAVEMFDEPVPVMPGYEILAVLGRGGMGVVYKARQIRLQRLVALKMILAGSHAGREDIARFRTEAEAVARLQHPNFVQVYEIGEHEGKPYLCLELCTGGSLEGKLKGAPLAFDEAARMMETLARAMQTAHDKNVIHRDLKPANILLGDDGTPKITDFGLAKKADEASQTISGVIMGTPSYMAPEQAGGKTREVGPLTDLYALGAILYQLLTGRPPFRAATPLETMAQVLDIEPVRPTQLQPKTPRDLETICLKCLEKDPRKRYDSALAMAEDLRRFLDQVPILARPTPAWERLLKWGRRKPVAAALVAVTFLAVVAGITAISFYGRYQSQLANALKQELKKTKEQEELRDRSNQLLLRSQQYEAEGRWPEVKSDLSRAEEALAAQTDPDAEGLLAEVRRRLDHVEERLAARKRRDKFHQPYDEALFNETLFTGEEVAVSQSKARAAAQAALAMYGLDAPSKTAQGATAPLQRDREFLDAKEYAELTRHCYELLLIWAEIESAPLAGVKETTEQMRRRAGEALALLARAEQIGKVSGLETRTFHVRKARYQAQLDGRKVDQDQIDRAVTVERTSAMDWFVKALELYRAGQRYDLAGDACLKVLGLEESHFWAHYLLALCQLRQGRWVEGQAQLTVCMNQKPDFVWPRLLRGFASSELGFRQTSEVLAAAEYKAADEDFVAALEKDKGKLVQYVGLVNRGVLNIRKKRWEEAEDYLRQAVKVNPEGFQAYVNLSQALKGQDDRLDQAAATLSEGIRRAPGQGEFYWSRAKIQLERKRPDLARKDFEKALTLAPANRRPPDWQVDSLAELGRLLQAEKQYKDSLARYDQALRLQPSFVLIHRFRAEVLLALDRDSEAGAALDQFIDSTASVPTEVYRARGLLYAEVRKFAEAIEMYTLALKEDPENSETRCHRGWTYLVMDAPKLALKDFDRCLGDDPRNADALCGRGNVRIRENKIESALGDAEAVEKVGVLTDRVLYNLARIYAQVAERTRSELVSVARPERGAKLRLSYYEDKSCKCLGEAMERLTEAKRSNFWEKQVEVDPGLSGIRRTKNFQRLAEKYGKNALPK